MAGIVLECPNCGCWARAWRPVEDEGLLCEACASLTERMIALHLEDMAASRPQDTATTIANLRRAYQSWRPEAEDDATP